MATLLGKMLHHMPDIWCYLMFSVILAHEMNRIPMVFCKLDIFLNSELPGYFLIPGVRVYQISFIVQVGFLHHLFLVLMAYPVIKLNYPRLWQTNMCSQYILLIDDRE